ncbi:MAG: helix-turn-helix domain-containing protein [Pseudomonadota bacterium]
MSTAGKSVIRGAEDALAFLRGDKGRARVRVVMVPERVDVRAMRRKLGMSQAKFAASFGINLRTLQEWEHGRAIPEGPVRARMTIIDREPKAVR